jgi:hypothetical protein
MLVEKLGDGHTGTEQHGPLSACPFCDFFFGHYD